MTVGSAEIIHTAIEARQPPVVNPNDVGGGCGKLVVLFRFATYGLLDHDFGNVGRAFTRFSHEEINYSVDRSAFGRDEQTYFTIDTSPETRPPTGLNECGTTGNLSRATFSPNGKPVRSGTFIEPTSSCATKTIGGLGNLDLRSLAGGSAAHLGDASTVQRLSVLREDGAVTGTPVKGELNTPLRITPTGTRHASVNAEQNDL